MLMMPLLLFRGPNPQLLIWSISMKMETLQSKHLMPLLMLICLIVVKYLLRALGILLQSAAEPQKIN